MVNNLSRAPKKISLKRLEKKTFDCHAPLSDYVTGRSMLFFDLLSTNGQEKAKAFLSKPPAAWHDDMIFRDMNAKVKLLKVVSDSAERGLALFQNYNNALTKDETQK